MQYEGEFVWILPFRRDAAFDNFYGGVYLGKVFPKTLVAKYESKNIRDLYTREAVWTRERFANIELEHLYYILMLIMLIWIW